MSRFRILGLNFLSSLKVMIGICNLEILSLTVKQLMKADIMNLGSRGQNAIYGIFWHQPKSKDEDLLRRGTHYVSQALKVFVAPGYIAVSKICQGQKSF